MKMALFAPASSIHTKKWASALTKRGIDVTVVTFSNHFEETDIKTISIDTVLPGKIGYLTAVLKVKKLLKQEDFDIVHAHYASSYGFVASLTSVENLFISVWGSDIYSFPKKNAIFRNILSLTLKKADVLCSTSHAMAEEAKKYTQRSFHVIPFGVDRSIFKPKKSDSLSSKDASPVIGIVKTLSDLYGIGELIQAFAGVLPNNPESKLMIIGDGPNREKYEKQVEDLAIKENVQFVGKVPNEEVPNYLNEMDIFVVPSAEYESFGVAAVEAMSCGLPVIVSDVDGLKEVVSEECGIITKRKDINALSSALLKLLADSNKRYVMGQAGIRRVKQLYDWEKNVDEMYSVYMNYTSHLNVTREREGQQ